MVVHHGRERSLKQAKRPAQLAIILIEAPRSIGYPPSPPPHPPTHPPVEWDATLPLGLCRYIMPA